MTIANRKLNDQGMSTLLGKLLRYGVLASSVIVLTGGLVYLFRHGREYPNYREFVTGPHEDKGGSIILFGLLVLAGTPIMRIAASVFGYLLEKDYLYLVLTMIVLTIVISGFWS